MNKGLWYAVGAYVLWGVLPVYWKALQTVPPIQIVGHRMVWSLIFVGALFLLKPHWSHFYQVVKHKKVLLIYFTAGSILFFNWFTYVWAVNAGYVVETALGYYINPLIYVVLGVLLLRERLRLWQWVAVASAAGGVLYLTFFYGSLPWIALVLAFSFGFYGLVKKLAPLPALDGLLLETALLFLPAFFLLFYQEASGSGAFGHSSLIVTFLLIFTGVATGLPLLWFAAAARRVPLTTIGVLQYIAPTMQFLLGDYLYHEPFTASRLIGFSLIWLALLIYTIEGAMERRKTAATQYARG
jgi:chloramphenicol-sensitive protein RarD